MTLRTFLRSRHFLIFISILIICICFAGISSIYSFSAYPDEFGYWSVAARLCGYDWSQVVSIGSYYSYGYSLILFIVFKIFKNGIIAYRAAIFINAVMQCACVWLTYIFICKIRNIEHEGNDSLLAAIISAIAVLYPAWSLYSQSTMSESLICFMFILVSFLMFSFVQKPGILNGLILGLLSMYLYLVHMRMIGTVIAIVLTFLVWALCSGSRRIRIGIASLIVVLILAFIVSFVIKNNIITKVYTYTSGDTLNWNDYSGQLPKIGKLFSAQGLLYLFENICGKVLYISLATYGLGIWGIGTISACFIHSIRSIRKKDCSGKDYFNIYIFLAILLQIGIALVYLIDSPSPDNPRLDLLLHGRYTDMLMPILFIYGIYGILKAGHPAILTIVLTVGDILLACPIFAVISSNNTGMNKLQGFTTAGVSYMLSTSDTDSKAFLVRALIFGIVLSWIVCIIVLIARRINQPLVVAGLVIIQLVLSIFTCYKYLYSIQPSVYTDILVTRKIEAIESSYPGKQIVHIFEGGVQYIEVLQFNMRDTNIDVINVENVRCDISVLPQDAIIVTSVKTIYDDELSSMYERSLSYGHLNIYFNEDK